MGGSSNNGLMLLGGGMPDERRREILAELLNSTDPQMFSAWFERMVGNCNDNQRQRWRALLGCGCDGTATLDPQRLRDLMCCGPNRRLSRWEEEDRRANEGDAIDLPTVQGGGASETVTVDAYGVPWYFVQFSVDGRVPDTGSLSKIEIRIRHANRDLVTFRVSQYYKESCCTTIAEEWRRYRRCMGYDSKFQIVITNKNANAGDVFTQGVFSWVRGYPADFDELDIISPGGCKTCP